MKQAFAAILALMMALGALAQRNVVYIEDFEICPDSTVTLPVMMANSDPTRGIQFNMSLPLGLNLIEKELTEYSLEKYFMVMFSNLKNGVWTLGMYPQGSICFPPDTAAIMTVTFKADPNFTGGEIILWRQLGSTMNNRSIVFDNDTTTVTVPAASIMTVPEDGQPLKEQYFNLSGQPLVSPDSVPVSIQVTTGPDGRRSSRKVAVRR